MDIKYLLFLCCTLFQQRCLVLVSTSQSCQKMMNSLVCEVNKMKDTLATYSCHEMRKEINDLKSQVESLQIASSLKAVPTQKGLANFANLAVTTTVLSTTADKMTVPPTTVHDCSEIKAQGNRVSRVYTIQPGHSGNPIQVFCDLESHGDGWTVIQRRQTGSKLFFDENWADYKVGFGDLENFTDFWLGNENIFKLTATENNIHRTYTLRVTMTDFSNVTKDAEYENFRIANEAELYKLNLNFKQGSAGDSLTYHNGMHFTTKDDDNDKDYGNCAREHKGGFWYKDCFHACLNCDSIVWRRWKSESLQKVEMKIRRSN